MPIRPENRARYPKDWKTISRRVRDDAGNRCEWCRVKNGATIYRGTHDDRPAYRYQSDPVFVESHCATDGSPIAGTCWDDFDARPKPVKVVLTVAHLDHSPENCARENLAALCQRCHNVYDAPARKAGIAARAKAKRASGDLFKK